MNRMRRIINSPNVRRHELSDRLVHCPHAIGDSMSRYWTRAKTGNWIVAEENGRHTYGRVLGRIEWAEMFDGAEPANGYLSVLAMSDDSTHAFPRWINPEHVTRVCQNPPASLFAFLMGPMPTADIVHKLAHYGTLSASYIGNAEHHIKAFQAGVSPAAWDAGVRHPEQD